LIVYTEVITERKRNNAQGKAEMERSIVPSRLGSGQLQGPNHVGEMIHDPGTPEQGLSLDPPDMCPDPWR
jgi:hypothetical protein